MRLAEVARKNEGALQVPAIVHAQHKITGSLPNSISRHR
jgi:hypothetical protein